MILFNKDENHGSRNMECNKCRRTVEVRAIGKKEPNWGFFICPYKHILRTPLTAQDYLSL